MSYNDLNSNPLDNTQPNFAPETPHLEDVLHLAMRAFAHDLRVCAPAVVAAVTGEQNVDLQLLLKTRAHDNTVSAMPIIRSCLVLMPIGQDWGIKQPLAVGDRGVAIFCDRSLDAWAVSNGGQVDPQDDRAHDLTDAFFLPGLMPISAQTTDKTTDLVLSNGKAKMRLQKGGRISFSNGTNELVDLMTQTIANQQALIDQLTSAIVLTSLGPAQFAATTLASFAQVKTAAQAILDKVNTIKGTS